MDATDETLMGRALALARCGEGRVEPNPMVGCVIVRDGRILGEGFHRRFGGPHAEVEALRTCKQLPRGATAYVTLEPCCHSGKTPPCTDALIDAGIREVVVPFRDPNPLVRGGGIRRLRRAGITVRTGVLVDEAAEVLSPFLTRVCLRRPYVIAKWAQTLNGRLVTPPGESRWLSCEASRRFVHRLRARVDAVLVGVGTVLADDPLLNARGVGVRRLAMRVVLDADLRIPLQSRLAATAKAIPTLVMTAREAMGTRRARMLEKRGVKVRPCSGKHGLLSLQRVMHALGELDVTNVLVEGGPRILSSFLREGLVDEAFVFVAPRCIGDGNRASSTSIDASFTPRRIEVSRSGEDRLYHLRLTSPPRV